MDYILQTTDEKNILCLKNGCGIGEKLLIGKLQICFTEDNNYFGLHTAFFHSYVNAKTTIDLLINCLRHSHPDRVLGSETEMKEFVKKHNSNSFFVNIGKYDFYLHLKSFGKTDAVLYCCINQ